jgi:hypothetical protein
MTTLTANGVYEALPKPIPNGRTYPRPKVRKPKPIGKFSEVLVIRPPVGNWRCDSCREKGWGARDLFAHHARTAHTRYTGDKDGTETL